MNTQPYMMINLNFVYFNLAQRHKIYPEHGAMANVHDEREKRKKFNEHVIHKRKKILLDASHVFQIESNSRKDTHINETTVRLYT